MIAQYTAAEDAALDAIEAEQAACGHDWSEPPYCLDCGMEMSEPDYDKGDDLEARRERPHG